MQKARRQTRRQPKLPPILRPLVGTRFQGLFIRHLAFFSPFPHGTGALSVTREYLALEGGPPGFTPDYTCPTLLGIPLGVSQLRVPGCHRLWRSFPKRFGSLLHSHIAVPQPQRCKHPWFGLIPVRSPLLGESRLLSVPPGTEMFQFPGLASGLRRIKGLAPQGVSPFGHRGITACMRLPRAYRSLPRPSSPSRAKASTVRLLSLDLIDRSSLLLLELSRCDSSTPRHHRRLSKSMTAPHGAARLQELKGRVETACGRHQSAFRAVQPAPTRSSRKEVIQPQVPLRLPCYDFAPVTELTLDGCLLAVSTPASGPPSFHGVTGGVYKARERIHRGVADPRLLAIPTSWSRVADSNPHLDRLLAIGSLSRVCDALYRPL